MYLLLLAHPGCPGQGPGSHKMVVVVVVVSYGIKYQILAVKFQCQILPSVADRYLQNNGLWSLHPFNGIFARSTWVSRQQKSKPFWILLKQEMTRWQWHQLDHMQIICTSLQASTSSLNFLWDRCSFWRPTNSVKALKYENNLCETVMPSLCRELVAYSNEKNRGTATPPSEAPALVLKKLNPT